MGNGYLVHCHDPALGSIEELRALLRLAGSHGVFNAAGTDIAVRIGRGESISPRQFEVIRDQTTNAGVLPPTCGGPCDGANQVTYSQARTTWPHLRCEVCGQRERRHLRLL